MIEKFEVNITFKDTVNEDCFIDTLHRYYSLLQSIMGTRYPIEEKATRTDFKYVVNFTCRGIREQIDIFKEYLANDKKIKTYDVLISHDTTYNEKKKIVDVFNLIYNMEEEK